MEISIEAVVDVDAAAWGQQFEKAPAEVEPSVQAHFAHLIHAELLRLGLGVPLGTTPVDGACEIRDDDARYLAWLTAHPDGYVINIARSHSARDARVHHANCRTLTTADCGGNACTGVYVKVCADDLSQLEQWAIEHVSKPIASCGTCRPRGEPLGPGVPAPTESPDSAGSPAQQDDRYEVQGPAAGRHEVEAWADDYIRFERRPAWQEQLRNEIRARCGQLKPRADEVLHATFFGDKPANADIENLLLYNIDTFRMAERNGIRFELGAIDSSARRFGYRYALTSKSDPFDHWEQRQTLASFGWTDLGAFVGEKKLAQVWLALACNAAEVTAQAAATPGAPFAIKVEIRPPVGRQPVTGGLVKGVVDGVVCAFQAHTDESVLPEVVARLVKDLPAAPDEIERCLLEQRRAVLGAVPKLVSPYRSGVKWDPADHLCVAGEVVTADPIDSQWAIKGEIVELSR